MMTLSEAIEHHRITRDTYMDQARIARRNQTMLLDGYHYWNPISRSHRLLGRPAVTWVTAYLFHEGAEECFIRHAREAHRRLLSILWVRRFLNSIPPNYYQSPGV